MCGIGGKRSVEQREGKQLRDRDINCEPVRTNENRAPSRRQLAGDPRLPRSRPFRSRAEGPGDCGRSEARRRGTKCAASNSQGRDRIRARHRRRLSSRHHAQTLCRGVPAHADLMARCFSRRLHLRALSPNQCDSSGMPASSQHPSVGILDEDVHLLREDKEDKSFSHEHIWPDALGGEALLTALLAHKMMFVENATACRACSWTVRSLKSWAGSAERATGALVLIRLLIMPIGRSRPRLRW